METLRHRNRKEMTESLFELQPEEAAVVAFLLVRMKEEVRERARKGTREGRPKALGTLLKQSVQAARHTQGSCLTLQSPVRRQNA